MNRMMSLLLLLILLTLMGGGTAMADVELVADGQARVVIHVPERLWDDPAKAPEQRLTWGRNGLVSEENQRRRLRESVRDFAGVLERMSGATIDIMVGAPRPGANHTPILIGELAESRFGPPEKSYPYAQGFRVVVTDDAVGFIGESDLATSYALYTLLHDLGCRWFIPGEMGEVVPKATTVSLPKQDVSSGPYTIYRGVWYADNDYGRRNRLGGMSLLAHHALEYMISKELREKHPEIRAEIGGQPHDKKIKWTHPIVIQGVIDHIRGELKKDPTLPTFSLSPMDALGWDEAYDPQHDAGDVDTSTGTISKTDRLIVMANRVAEAITADYPDVLFGVLAYVDYTRPPVREQVHPNVVPQIAPITYSRAHPMTDDNVPNNKELRYIVEGWGKAVESASYYFYGWFLAELSGPNPMIRKWSTDIPIIYEKGAARFWQPETITNFESSMHALHLGNVMAWSPAQDPANIIDDLHDKFYGEASEEMAAYWHYVDSVWVDVPEYSGGGWGHLRRFTPERMTRMRELLDAGKAAARTDAVKARIKMADESLTQFERFIQLRRDLAEGRFANLADDSAAYMERMGELGLEYAEQYAFGKVGSGMMGNINVRYFASFYKNTYDDAARIAREATILTPTIRSFRYRVDEASQGESEAWYAINYDDSDWPTTDVAVDTWSALGLHDYMGKMWYRTTVHVPEGADGQRVHLWIGATDGSAKLFVNGKHVPFVAEGGEEADAFQGHATPASFDVTEAVRRGEDNQITLLCHRRFLNELGTGGLLAPVVLYSGE